MALARKLGPRLKKVKNNSRAISVWQPGQPAASAPVVRQQIAVRQAQREITYWTTKDGREIPLEEMSDDHIANAVRVLSLWRVRLKKRDGGSPVIKDLAEAISRFKGVMRRRRKAIARTEKAATGRRISFRKG